MGPSSGSRVGAGLQDRFIEKIAVNYRCRALSGTRLPLANLGLLGLLGLLGCGQQYRPVVAAISPVGPAAQPTKYAIAVSSPGATGANGLLTVVDFSGDSILATPEVVPLGTAFNPEFFTILPGGSQGFIVNAQGSLSDVPLTSTVSLLTSSVVQTTLPAPSATGPTCSVNAAPFCDPSLSAFTFGTAPRILVPEVARSSVAILSTSSPALQQEITVPANPVYVVGYTSTPRAYVLSTGTGTTPGQASAIESSSLSVSATLNVGINPTYGIETTDNRRAFVLNQGSGTVSVINVVNNALDSAVPTITLPAPINAAQANPVWADLSTVTNELVVLNKGDGTDPGSLDIISIPLCNALAEPTNPSCNPSNPVDGVGFGTVLASVPVGVNPSMVSVLADGTKAYVVNSGNTATAGSVSIVNLASGTILATIPAVNPSTPEATPTCPGSAVGVASCVYGAPTTVAATTGTPTGKVYVTAPNSNYMTVIETDTNTVDTYINLQGVGVRVQVSAP